MNKQSVKVYLRYFTIYKLRLAGFLLITLLIYSCKNQRVSSKTKCDPCNSKVLGRTDKQLEAINENDIKKFLCTLQSQCKDDIEFAEQSNNILFTLINKQTDTLLQCIDRNKDFDRNYLLNQLANPIKDYNIDEIISKAEKSNISEELKTQLIKARHLVTYFL